MALTIILRSNKTVSWHRWNILPSSC